MKKKSEAKKSLARGGSGGAHALATKLVPVLHIDDDPNDTELLEAASRQAKAPFRLQYVPDAEHAMAYVNGQGVYGDRLEYPMPVLILLDLKLPRASGFEVLRWMRSRPQLVSVPIVVFSGSERQEDIQQAYSMGANSYIVKPLGFSELVRVVETIHTVWLSRPAREAGPVPALHTSSVPAHLLNADFV